LVFLNAQNKIVIILILYFISYSFPQATIGVALSNCHGWWHQLPQLVALTATVGWQL